jgi:hypothetical protein
LGPWPSPSPSTRPARFQLRWRRRAWRRGCGRTRP